MPEVSVSKTRVYYLDGDSTLRSLTPTGSRSLVLMIPGSATAHAGFAVSPDDGRIAISVIDYARQPPVTHLYVEALPGGTSPTEIFTSNSVYVWPVGWHAGKLVLAVGPATAQYAGGDPYGSYTGDHIVDPATATRLSTLCGSNMPMGSLVPAGSLCMATDHVLSEGWSGSRRSLGTGCLALAPSGVHVACSADVAHSGSDMFLVEPSGSRVAIAAKGWSPGWIDDENVVVAADCCGPSSKYFSVFNVVTGAQYPITVDATFFGRLPGDLG
jgi:hypothetical protein